MATSIEIDVEKTVNVRKFLEQWDDSIKYSSVASKKQDETIAAKLGLPVETITELSAVCSPKTLYAGNEDLDQRVMLETIPSDVPLLTLRCQAEDLEKRASDPTYAAHVLRKMKYNYVDWYRLFKVDERNKKDSDNTKVKDPSVVLSVQIHKPFNNTFANKPVVTEAFLVLGDNKLSDLQEVIKCPNDYAVAGDLSLAPDSDQFSYAKDVFKSGFFFIENTFYNDMRHDDNRDYSQTIVNWMNQENRSQRMGPYSKAKMEETTFYDLDIVVGKPYFYQHQGDCEHLIVFSDIRISHPKDPQDVQSYPYLIREKSRKRKICKACLINTAGWIIYNCSLLPSNPTYLCHRCTKALLYDQDNNKVTNFEAYKSATHPP